MKKVRWDYWNVKCVEPVKRRGEWVVHRFEIKGGISIREALIRDMCQPNPLLAGFEPYLTWIVPAEDLP